VEDLPEYLDTPTSFICSYRKPHLIMAGACLGLSLIALYFPVSHYATYHTFGAVNEGTILDGLGYIAPMFLVFGVGFLLTAVWFLLSALNQSISVFHGTICWRGILGKIRVNCRYEEAVAFSLRLSWHKGSYSCEMETTRGPIRWDSNISSAETLLKIAKRLAQQHDL
jgi:hypothetical protein